MFPERERCRERLPSATDEGRRFAIKTDSNTEGVSTGWFRAIRLRAWTGRRRRRVQGEYPAAAGCHRATRSRDRSPANIGNDDMAYWAARGCYSTDRVTRWVTPDKGSRN